MNSFENFSFEYGVSEQITPLVKRVTAKNPGPFTYTGTGTFIVGTKELAVIDPGPIDNNHLNAIIKACGKSKISHIIITHTHNDHSPLSKPLQKKTGAPIYSFFNKNMDTKTDNQFEEGYDNSFKPDIVINITGYLDKKIEAVRAYKSQLFDSKNNKNNTPISTENFLNSVKYRAQNLGRLIGTEAGEGFTSRQLLAIKELDSLIK